MDGEGVEQLLDVVLQMKINLAHITETLHQQTLEIRHQLGIIFEKEKESLEECLIGIDRKLKECSTCVENYQKLYAQLNAMREKIVLLGGCPGPMPATLPADEIDVIVAWRLRELKAEGKI
jgi:hypothetical protein